MTHTEHAHTDPEHTGPDHTDQWHDIAPADFWEERYAGADRRWSGKVNPAVEAATRALTPGTALDLGCGEGGDVIWLAEHGWRAHGIDISPTATARGAAIAAERGLTATFEALNLSTWEPSGAYDLVTSSFFHSPVGLERAAILHRAAAAVAAGGHLLVVTHASPPPWADPEHVRRHTFVSAREEADALGFDPAQWDEVTVADVERIATGPDGTTGPLTDGVVLLRKRD